MGVRRILTPEALENAIRVFLTVGGSTNALLHIAAIAYEAEQELGMEVFDRLGRETPFLVNCRPAGEFDVSDLHDAGGVQAVMKELAPLLHPGALTVTGRTVGENVAEANVRNRRLIAPLGQPLQPESGYAVLKGNLAADGAIVKGVAVPPSMMRFEGPARVFESEQAATNALIEGKVETGDVVVVRNQGPSGDPGMRQTGALFANILVGMGLADKVAFVTDGRLSGSNEGLLVAHASPEAAVGGGLAAVQEGDLIEIDIPARKLSLRIPQTELKKRLSEWKPPVSDVKNGFLKVYERLVQQANRGAVFAG